MLGQGPTERGPHRHLIRSRNSRPLRSLLIMHPSRIALLQAVLGTLNPLTANRARFEQHMSTSTGMLRH